jgi:hypothetical protein
MRCVALKSLLTRLQPAVVTSCAATFIVSFMAKSNDIKENFSALLRDSLRSRFGRIPSAAVVAREFNLRAYDTTPISQESARRWLRGVSLPEEERLRVLVNWLNLDFNEALKPRTQPFGQRPGHEAERPRGPEPAQPARRLSAAPRPIAEADSLVPQSNGASPDDAELLSLLMVLDTPQKRAMLELIKSGFRPPASSPQ